MSLTKLYDLAREIPKELAHYNKYTYASYRGLIDGRLVNINDILDNLDSEVLKVVEGFGAVLLFPTKVGDEIVSIQLLTLFNEDRKRTLLGNKEIPLFLQYLGSSFKYGDTIILVEGIGDVAGLKLLDNDLIVIPTNSDTISSKLLELIPKLTNNVIVIADNDEKNWGIKGANKTKRKLNNKGVNCNIITRYNNLKDTGDIIDLVIKYEKTKDSLIEKELNNILKYYKTSIELYK